MKERPILFNAPMVRALLDGSKTQTRRMVKYSITGPNPPASTFDWRHPKTNLLTEQGGDDADLAAVLAARDALGRADERVAQGKAWNLDGPGREAIRRALEVHDEQTKTRGQAALTDAILVMHQRQAQQVRGVA